MGGLEVMCSNKHVFASTFVFDIDVSGIRVTLIIFNGSYFNGKMDLQRVASL